MSVSPSNLIDPVVENFEIPVPDDNREASNCINDDFPAPDGPMMAVNPRGKIALIDERISTILN